MERLAGSKTEQSLSGARLLLVEDDAILLMELAAILRGAGAEIATVCRSVDDALAVLGREAVSAAVLDVRVGKESIAPVARQLDRQGTPFVFYTGQTGSDPTLTEWSNCKVVAKPAPAKTLVAAVADILASP